MLALFAMLASDNAGSLESHSPRQAVKLTAEVKRAAQEVVDDDDDSDHERFRATPLQGMPPVAIDLYRQQMKIKSVGDVLHYKSAYYGTLQVGTPAQPYTFVFDTGSGHMVLPSGYCQSRTCKAHKRYRRNASTSALDIDFDGEIVDMTQPRDQISVQFGTGEISGVFIDDIVCMEDSILESLAGQSSSAADIQANDDLPHGCMRMRFIAATEMSEDPFMSFKFDGVLGLGLGGLSKTEQFNFINMIAGPAKNWGAELPNTFAVFLAEHQDEDSELSIGGWNQDHLQDDMYWNPVLDPELGHWLIKVKSVRVNDEVLDFCKDGTCRAVVDTGTSLMAVPSKAFPQVYERLRYAAPVSGFCTGKGPQLHFELEHFTITMGPEDWARPEWYETHQDTEIAWPEQAEHQDSELTRRDMYCRPMLMAMDIPEPVGPKLFILGEPVMRKYYTVYDSDKKMVGVGRAKHPVRVIDDEATQADDSDESWFYDDSDDIEFEE